MRCGGLGRDDLALASGVLSLLKGHLYRCPSLVLLDGECRGYVIQQVK